MTGITYIKKQNTSMINFYFNTKEMMSSIPTYHPSKGLNEIHFFHPVSFTQKFYKNLIHKNSYEYMKQYD